MDNNIKVRNNIFDKLMEIEENRRNWEMLCSSDKPLIPFIGAGISAWCYPMWDSLLKDVVEENFSQECSKIVAEALQNWEDKPDVSPEDFRWMEEIAEYIFDDDEDEFNKSKHNNISLLKNIVDWQKKPNRIFKDLNLYFGGYGVNSRRAAVKSLYEKFSIAQLKNAKKVPEYQNFFPRLFPDLLLTTNYDKALEYRYPSIFSYSYSDLNQENGSSANKESWLYRAIEEKLEQMQARLEGVNRAAGETIPDIPMLLKVHGSIEQASNIALTKSRYDEVYKGKMPELFGEICRHSSLLFLGCGLREDRTLEELKKQEAKAACKNDHSFRHFAFCPAPEKATDMEKQKQHLAEYRIYPIFYKKDVLPKLYNDGEADWHSDCLGILLENLLHRKMRYHQPLELLWDKCQSTSLKISGSIKNAARLQSISDGSQYIHMEEASQIWELLKSNAECPLIAVTGDTGSGKSTFCQNIQKLNKSPKDAMRFFYISLEDCKTWNEFCIQIYENLSIGTSKIEEMKNYLAVAEQVEQRCSGYWRSVLIFDHLDELKDDVAYPGQWDIIKEMLLYWKKHRIRVIFTVRQYPKGISCYTWRIDSLTCHEAKKVFFSACTSGRYENSSLLELNILNKLFSRQTFRPASAYLIGRYADSKNDLVTLLDEWESCHVLGDSEEQTLARLIWKHLLDEHQWADKSGCERQDIEKNILWIWGILGGYPGIFPKAFFECLWSDEPGYRNKTLSRKTLMYMKNAGLCEETIDEKYDFWLKNMIQCAKKFSNKLKSGEEKDCRITVVGYANLDGLKSFYGYTMDKYDGDLRKHILMEWEKRKDGMARDGRMDAADSILDILEALGEEVKSDEKRKCHKDLNLVLHYEIKTVISFLTAQLSRADTKKNVENGQKIAKITNIGYLFSHYYHYVPSHAFPLVQRLLEIVKESTGNCGKNNALKSFELYKLANLHKVMGDIYRLLGRKEEAVTSYITARELCDEQMLLSFTSTNSMKLYQESQRIKAGILLINNYYGSNADNEAEEAGAIYKRLENEWGNAYYNQRKGETIYAEKPESVSVEKHFEKVCKCYNAAAVHYGKVEDMTGIAYILKCMGDLIGKYREVYRQNNYLIEEAKNGSVVYYQILVNDEFEQSPDRKIIEDSCKDGIYAAACCYTQAFVSYCSHINWRGFANVLQGMGNLLRYYLLDGKGSRGKMVEPLDPQGYEEIEMIFGFAEECYRWLGDMRGLADTLDYAGYGYKEKGGAVAEYMALGKWMESREIWKWLGDDAKVSKITEKISELRKKVNDMQ